MRTLFLKAVRGQFFVEMLMRLRGLIILPIATRELGPTGYGWIAFAAALTGLVGTIATLGMPSAMSRFLPAKQTDAERASIFWPGFMASVASVAFFAALTVLVLHSGALRPQEIPFALIVLASVNVVSNELKMYLYGFWRYSLELKQYYRFLQADAVFAGVAQLVVLLVLHRGPLAIVASVVVVDVAMGLVAAAALLRRLPWSRLRWAIVRPLYIFGLPLAATGLLNWANNTADRFFIQAYRGSASVGIYSVGYNLGFLAVSVIATPLFAILSSLLFREWDQGRPESAERLLRTSSSLLVLGSLPFIFSLSYFGGPFIRVMAGPRFANAHSYIALVAAGYLLMFFGDLYGYPLWRHNRQYFYSLCMVVSVGVNLLGNALFVPRYGAIASAAATTASLGALAVTLVIVNLYHGYSRPPLAANLAIAVVAAVCWFATARAWPSTPNLLHTAVFSVVTTLIFGALVYALRLVPEHLRETLSIRRASPQ
jgi:O-antigen/teichoic acid export membrane protein